MSSLVVDQLSMKFGEFFAVNKVSFIAGEGEFVTLLGPSGCGKTTLLKMLAGFYPPYEGVVFIDGKDVTSIPPERRNTSMCFQSYALFPHLSVEENIVFGLRQKRTKGEEREKILHQVSQQVDLSTQLKKTPHQLSGGQQQRVSLARAMAMRTGVILFDEPLSNLDAKLREQVRIEILELQKNHGFTAVYVTHDQSEALAMSDKIIVMNKGRVIQKGPPREIYRNPVNSFVADFIGTANILEAKIEKQRGEHEYLVTTPMGAMTVHSSESPFSSHVKIAWRPEAARLGKEEGTENLFEGLIDLAVYQGNHMDVRLHQKSEDSKGNTTCRLQIFQNEDIRRGDRLRFHIPPQEIRFLESI